MQNWFSFANARANATAIATASDYANEIIYLYDVIGLVATLCTIAYIDKDQWSLYYQSALEIHQTIPILIAIAVFAGHYFWVCFGVLQSVILIISLFLLIIIVFILRKKESYEKNQSISNLLMDLKHSYYFDPDSTEGLFPLDRHQKKRLFKHAGLQSLLCDHDYLMPIQQSRSSYWNTSSLDSFKKEFKNNFGISGNYSEVFISAEFKIDKSELHKKERQTFFESEKRSQEVYRFAMPRSKKRLRRRVKSNIMKLMEGIQDPESAEIFLREYGCYYIDSVTLGGYAIARAEQKKNGTNNENHNDARSKINVMKVAGFNFDGNSGEIQNSENSINDETVEFFGGGKCPLILSEKSWDTWVNSILEEKNLVIVECKFNPIYKLAPDENEPLLQIAHDKITEDRSQDNNEDEDKWSNYFSDAQPLHSNDEKKFEVNLTAKKKDITTNLGHPENNDTKHNDNLTNLLKNGVLVELKSNDTKHNDNLAKLLKTNKDWFITFFAIKGNASYCSIMQFPPENDKEYEFLQYKRSWSRRPTFMCTKKISLGWKFEIEKKKKAAKSLPDTKPASSSH